MRLALLAAVTVLLAACATVETQLRELAVGISKDEVVRRVGKPKLAYAPVTTRSGQQVQVVEYDVGGGASSGGSGMLGTVGLLSGGAGGGGSAAARNDRVWLTFVDGKLTQRTPAGDWRRERDRLRTARFPAR